jgi:hypothetical protein
MLVFPQLSTGTVALYPLQRRRLRRTVTNQLAGGQAVRYSDPDFSTSSWELEITGANLTEWTAIEQLFMSTAGRAKTFTFLEPAGNLLLQSEALAAPEWNPSALISLMDGIEDPFGGISAARVLNAAPTSGDLSQPIAVPGNFQYAFSVWARAGSTSSVGLFASTDGGEVERSFTLTSEWKRVVLPVTLGLATESVTFGARLVAGDSVELFGMQVDAQPGPGGYQKTDAKGGVHSNARFDDDVLKVSAQGPDVFDAVIRVVSKGN